MDTRSLLLEVRSLAGLSQERLAHLLGVSFVSVNRWERGASSPSPAQAQKLASLHAGLKQGAMAVSDLLRESLPFASRGARRNGAQPELFESPPPSVELAEEPLPPILQRVAPTEFFSAGGKRAVEEIFAQNQAPAATAEAPPESGVSAGKNTYTYDAHTYHTKVPPQGIAELIKHYLPTTGIVLDPFAGSGMTGVAASVVGRDCVLSDLAPAACFIAREFVSRVDPSAFWAAVRAVLAETRSLRRQLNSTTCRECGKTTEILYTVWSYRVVCPHCETEFTLWDQCRRYGKKVREHKIVSRFACPNCDRQLVKSRLRRTVAEPVQVAYVCCGSRQKEVAHDPNLDDLKLIYVLETAPPLAEGYYPTLGLPDGVNLNQPKRHGLDRIDKFYTGRNLAGLSHLWRAIHRLKDPELAAAVGFVFTSLYQRVTRLSEFRFWGGSGNTARFNVPFIFNEANIFVTFERKARSIRDHLETTAREYRGRVAVIQASATELPFCPDSSVDLIFTDPPFGANINYSEMNILWESWLQRYTNNSDEAVVNRAQGKGVAEYQVLMTRAMRECYRVLRPGHWMLLVFMNSSAKVWEAVRSAVEDAGFSINRADIFDKEHGTFKQFVSANTAGADLVLHCRKPVGAPSVVSGTSRDGIQASITRFLGTIDPTRYRNEFLHVGRASEVDFRRLYSEWLAEQVVDSGTPTDFVEFRRVASEWLGNHSLAR